MSMTASGKPIRVGVIGVGRGETFMRQTAGAGMELVAICDAWEERLRTVGQRHGITTYTDYDKFLDHDMDAVVLANYFHQHAPFAIKALNAGKHVMSECAACNTLAEGVALCRAVEQTGKIYMFAENYPFTAFNQEMARLYKAGEIGRILYAEGEYNHPGSFEWHAGISPGLRHWRNNLPATYYCTHAMAPLMAITDTMPVRVNGFTSPLPEDSSRKRLWRRKDVGGLIIVKMDNGATFKLLQGGLPGHSIFYRLHGEKVCSTTATATRCLISLAKNRVRPTRTITGARWTWTIRTLPRCFRAAKNARSSPKTSNKHGRSGRRWDTRATIGKPPSLTTRFY